MGSGSNGGACGSMARRGHLVLKQANNRDLVADFKLGTKRIGVQTDGGLQILLPQRGNNVEWDRSYYEIALEVFTLPHSLESPTTRRDPSFYQSF